MAKRACPDCLDSGFMVPMTPGISGQRSGAGPWLSWHCPLCGLLEARVMRAWAADWHWPVARWKWKRATRKEAREQGARPLLDPPN